MKDVLGTRRKHLRNPARETEENRSAGTTSLSAQIRIHSYHPANPGRVQRQNRRGTGGDTHQRARRRTHHGDPPDGQGRLRASATKWPAAAVLRKEGRGRRRML